MPDFIEFAAVYMLMCLVRSDVWHTSFSDALLMLLPLQSMLAQDPKKRPSAEELLKTIGRTASKSGLPLASSGAGTTSAAAAGANTSTSSSSRRSL